MLWHLKTLIMYQSQLWMPVYTIVFKLILGRVKNVPLFRMEMTLLPVWDLGWRHGLLHPHQGLGGWKQNGGQLSSLWLGEPWRNEEGAATCPTWDNVHMAFPQRCGDKCVRWGHIGCWCLAW